MRRLFLFAVAMTMALLAGAQTYIERLSRGVVAVPSEKGNFISWRFLATDAPSTQFNLMRDGEVIASAISTKTNYVDEAGTPASKYCVQTLVGGSVTETSDEVQVWSQPYLSVPLIRPLEQEMPDGRTCSYTPNDCSAADVDGDGEYEIILKWDPSNAHDNSHTGYTGEVYLDCYKPAGILMWRISLGKNIRAGAHYTQFMVYDLDGDGKAELVCKTAPGSKDGKGDYVTEAATDPEIKNADNNADYRAATGHIITGPEYLTVFNGKDGKAMHTIFYNPNRAFGVGGAPEYAEGWGGWGDTRGNRSERYLACVAFLGGKDKNPSAVMCRGYYTRSYLWAVDFDGKQLSTRWLHASVSRGKWQTFGATGEVIVERDGLEATAYGQGAHGIAVGDVDGDGCDEIMYGSAAINNDGTLLYSTGLGHGDAHHLSDLDPDRQGLEFFMVHESRPYGHTLRDARTGELLVHKTGSNDTGRGMAADLDAAHRGGELVSLASRDLYDVKGNAIAEPKGCIPQNFRIYWDGDLQDELIGNGGGGQRPGTWGNTQQRGQTGQRGGQRQDRDGQRQGREGMPDFRNMTEAQRDSLRQRMQRERGQQMPRQASRQRYYIAKWTGDSIAEVKLNGKSLSDYGNSSSCNGTKATPCLQADLFGDWREELVLFDAGDRSHLNIFTTNIPTDYRVVTPMHDHVYRMGVVWQNVAYNQPPHLGYYLPDQFKK